MMIDYYNTNTNKSEWEIVGYLLFVGFVYGSLGLDHVRTMNVDLKTEGKGRLWMTGPTHRTLLDLLYYKTRTSLNFTHWKMWTSVWKVVRGGNWWRRT